MVNRNNGNGEDVGDGNFYIGIEDVNVGIRYGLDRSQYFINGILFTQKLL